MYVIGVDLSGPANPDSTAMAVFRVERDILEYDSLIASASDAALYEEIRRKLAIDDVCVGLDAPLSYGITGGQRESDAALRARTIEAGLPPGSVMAPTAPRMVYLTLRGLAVARGSQLLGGPGEVRVVETHPGAAMALAGAPIDAVRGFRENLENRRHLLQWLTDQGLRGIGRHLVTSDHSVAACAAAWATWRWSRGESTWLYPAEPPHHPFDFAC
jgi:predicted nuclease with RNAse H fold